jgi:hypothetical protein
MHCSKFTNNNEYLREFPKLALPPQQQRSISRDPMMDNLEKNLMEIVNEGSSASVQLVRLPCLSPTALKIKVGLIKGWNPPIKASDRDAFINAYNAFQNANKKFDDSAVLGDFPPLMNF